MFKTCVRSVFVAALLLSGSLFADGVDRSPNSMIRLQPFVGGTSTSVVISQVYGGGGNSGSTWKNDFIEILNISSSPVDLTGWSVQYASSTGSSWQVTALSGTIGPGQYFLVKEAQGAGGTTNLPTPDVNGSIAMSGSSGKVALVSSTGALSGTCPSANIVDFVGYGSAANCFEGTGGTPTLSNTTAALRNNNGCDDAGSNAADFSTGAPNPRNSTSPLNACSGGGGGPFITTGSPLPNATVGAEYGVTFAAAGGTAPYTFLLMSGTLPPGLDLESDGLLSGEVETTLGSPFSFTIQVTDSAALTSSKVFQLTVRAEDTCPVDGPAPRSCGVERWSVKTGTDPDAALVDINSATPATIAALRAFPYPASIPSNGRVAPEETTQWVIHGRLTKYKLEDDSDYHLVVQDGSGITMVTESVFPGDSPACVGSSSPFLPGIAQARCEMDSSLPYATGSFQTVSVPVRVTGVGMHDFSHGQTGAAPNQIELHPIVDIAFPQVANASTPQGSTVNIHMGDVLVGLPSVTAAGTSTSTPIEPSVAGTAPSGTLLVGPAYTIATTATVSGNASTCIALNYLTDATAFAKVKLLHAESGSLVDRTTSRSYAAKILCGSLPTFTENIVVALANTAGSVSVNEGNNQSVPPNGTFQPLKVIVRDGSSNPLAGVAVTFSVNGSGSVASGVFSSSSPVVTDANGTATAPNLTANGVTGSFTVSASAAGIASLVTLTESIIAIDPPTNVVATATSSTTVSITWNASSGATSYEVVRIAAGGVSTTVGTAGSTFITDASASADTAYLYKVRAIAPGESAFSASDLATTSMFTDSALMGVSVKAIHVNELRTAVDAVRALAGLVAFSYSDASLAAGMTIEAPHLTELRTALDQARSGLSLPAISYTSPTIIAGVTVVSASNLEDIRDGTR